MKRRTRAPSSANLNDSAFHGMKSTPYRSTWTTPRSSRSSPRAPEGDWEDFQKAVTTLIQPAREIERRIPHPREDRPPLKVNIFERMQAGNCQLLPLFPYEDADSLVPAGAIFRGEHGADFGQFFHFNTVDEVAHVFGANGALLQTGQIYATQPLHGVNSFLKDPTNPDNFLVLTVTQHQRASGPQSEAVIFRCGKCHELLERYEYDAQPAPRSTHPRTGVPLLTT